jgi:hypothetical protein
MSARNYIAVQIQLESMKQQSLPYLISGRMRFNQKMSAVDRLSTRSTEDFMDSARSHQMAEAGQSSHAGLSVMCTDKGVFVRSL